MFIAEEWENADKLKTKRERMPKILPFRGYYFGIFTFMWFPMSDVYNYTNKHAHLIYFLVSKI